MKMIAILTIITADRWKMDTGQSAGRVYVMDETPTENPDAVGRPVLEFATDYEQIPLLKPHSEKFPCKFECEIKQVQGAKKKVTMRIESFKLLAANSPSK